MLAVLTVAAAVSAALCAALIPLLRRVAVDSPTGRSSHVVPTPRGAGVAIVAGAVAGAIAGGVYDLTMWIVLAATCGVAGLGLVDDLRGLGVKLRLVVVSLSALGVSSGVLHGWDGSALATLLAIGLSTFFVLAYTNAFNFMDGINGISGLVTVVVASTLAWNANAVESMVIRNLAAALAVAALAFLPYNLPRARTFMGDAGSYGVGFLLGCLAVWSVTEGVSITAVAAPYLLYIADTGVTLIKRRSDGKRLSEPHREHVYQRLADGFRSHAIAALLVSVCTVALALLASADGLSDFVRWIGAAVVLIGYLVSPRWASRREALGHSEA